MPRIITFDCKISPEQLLFTLEDQPILSIGNIMGITADIGVGKSQICEIFAAYWLNPSTARHNIHCINSDGQCMYIDTERTENYYKKILKRNLFIYQLLIVQVLMKD